MRAGARLLMATGLIAFFENRLSDFELSVSFFTMRLVPRGEPSAMLTDSLLLREVELLICDGRSLLFSGRAVLTALVSLFLGCVLCWLREPPPCRDPAETGFVVKAAVSTSTISAADIFMGFHLSRQDMGDSAGACRNGLFSTLDSRSNLCISYVPISGEKDGTKGEAEAVL